MADIAGIINQINDFTQTMGVIQGAAEAFTPAIYQVEGAINQVASVFQEPDTYQPNPYPVYPVYPPQPVGNLNEGKIGVVTSMLSGGAAGGVMHKSIANNIRDIKAGTPGAMKGLAMSSLKAGGIGAAISGVISAAKNMNLASKGMQSNGAAMGNIAADTVGGLITGAAGGISAGAASMALANMLPGGGLLATLGTVAAGALGATAGHFLYQGTGIRDGIASALGGGNTNNYGYGYQQPAAYPQQYPQQAYGY